MTSEDARLGLNIRLFLVDGSPNGMITAEIMNWTGHILFAPRSRIVDLLQRPEAGRTGVYLLIGEDLESDGQPSVYVGEGDNVGIRIAYHGKDPAKDFWQLACLVTSKDTNLTKTHVRYLESRLVGLIKREGRARLTNGTAPEGVQLPEAERSDMEFFIGQLQVLLPVLGLTFVRSTRTAMARPSEVLVERNELLDPHESAGASSRSTRAVFGQSRPSVSGAESPLFLLTDRTGGVTARAVEADGRMVILAHSQAKETELPSLANNIRAYRRHLLETGKLSTTDRPGILKFNEDVAFTSPSAAAQAVMGTSRNGRTDWIVEGRPGQNYASWQEEQISKSLSIQVRWDDEDIPDV